MITEDYVSFEVAKLLKEKGFDGECSCYYFSNNETQFEESLTHWNWNDGYTFRYSAPTLQMVMKWLRNKHDIVCSVGLFTDFPGTLPYWSFNILNQSTADVMYEAFDIKCESYEPAAESAIKYCLENLI